MRVIPRLGIGLALGTLARWLALRYVEFSATARALAPIDRPFVLLGALGVRPLEIVPASAQEGANVAGRSPKLAWFDGPTVAEALGRFCAPAAPVSKPLRLPIQAVYRFDHRRIIAGRIESGRLHVGDDLLFLPSGKRSRVKTIERWNRPPTEPAAAGDAVGITLTEPLFVERGEVASAVEELPFVTTELRARVFWLGKAPLITGRSYGLRLTTQETDCELAHVHQVIDASSLQEHEGADMVGRHEVADVTIRTKRPIVVDRFADLLATGRFVLVDSLDIGGGGVVADVPFAEPAKLQGAPVLVQEAEQVERDERTARNRHGGAVVWFTGLSGAGKSTLANALERALFDRGMQVFVLDGDNVRLGLNSDLGFSAPDRAENIRRVAEVAKLFAEAGIIVATALISPYRSDRLRARQIMGEGGLDIPFIERFLDAPVDVCARRDPRGLYAKARRGEIKAFTGVSDPYERPETPELVLRTDTQTIDECLENLIHHLLPLVDARTRSG